MHVHICIYIYMYMHMHIDIDIHVHDTGMILRTSTYVYTHTYTEQPAHIQQMQGSECAKTFRLLGLQHDDRLAGLSRSLGACGCS